MRIRGFAAAQEARLLGHEAQMSFAAIAARLWYCEQALVDSLWLLGAVHICGRTSLRRSSRCVPNVGLCQLLGRCRLRKLEDFFLKCILYDLSVGGGEGVLHGEHPARPVCGSLARLEICYF